MTGTANCYIQGLPHEWRPPNDGEGVRKRAMATPTIPEIQQLALDVFGRRLTAAEVRALGRGVEAMANSVRVLETYLDKSDNGEPATVPHFTALGDDHE
jgi:hypothetical protein